MEKCFKLPVIQVCIAFEGFFPGSLRGKNRVVSRYKISIFTIVKITKSTWGIYQNKEFHCKGADVDNWWILKTEIKKTSAAGMGLTGGCVIKFLISRLIGLVGLYEIILLSFNFIVTPRVRRDRRGRRLGGRIDGIGWKLTDTGFFWHFRILEIFYWTVNGTLDGLRA